MTRLHHPDDEQLAAWLAGDLDPDADRAVSAAVDGDPEVARRADRISAVMTQLALGASPPMPPDAVARLQTALAAALPGGVGPGSPTTPAVSGAAVARGEAAGGVVGTARPSGRPRSATGPRGRATGGRRRHLDRVLSGTAVLLLVVVASTVAIRSFRDGSVVPSDPAPPTTVVEAGADDGGAVGAGGEDALEGPASAGGAGGADTTAESEGAVPTADAEVDQPAGLSGSGSGSASGSGPETGAPGGAGSGATGLPGAAAGPGTSGAPGTSETPGPSGSSDPPPPPPGPSPDAGAGAGDGEAASGADPATGPAPQPSAPSAEGPTAPVAPDQPAEPADGGGVGGGPDEDEAAPPPSATGDAAGPEQAPESAETTPLVRDSQVVLPDAAAVRSWFADRPEASQLLGLSGGQIDDRAAAHAQAVRDSGAFASGDHPADCLGTAGAGRAVVAAVESATYADEPSLAYLVVSGDPLDRARVLVLAPSTCTVRVTVDVPA